MPNSEGEEKGYGLKKENPFAKWKLPFKKHKEGKPAVSSHTESPNESSKPEIPQPSPLPEQLKKEPTEKNIENRMAEITNAAQAAQKAIVEASIAGDIDAAAIACQHYALIRSDFKKQKQEIQELRSSVLNDKISLTEPEASKLKTVVEQWRTTLSQKAYTMTPDLARDTPAKYGETASPVISANDVVGENISTKFWMHLNANQSYTTISTPDGNGIELDELRAGALLMSASKENILNAKVRINDSDEWTIEVSPSDQKNWNVTHATIHEPSKDTRISYEVNKGYREMKPEEINNYLSHYPGIVEAMKPTQKHNKN